MKMMIKNLLRVAGIVLIGFHGYGQDEELGHLTCEYIVTPRGVDKAAPLLGWQLYAEKKGVVQSAYQIIVSSDKHLSDRNTGDVWNSGKTNSSESQNVYYAGRPLQSGKYYFWKVKIWDADGRETKWSATSFWLTGKLNKTDWRAKWISNKFAEVSGKRESMPTWGRHGAYTMPDTPALYLRKMFSAHGGIKTAIAFISGLGYYELNLNGAKVGDRVMDPVFSDYQKTVGYATYDVTGLLHPGRNTIGVILGNGFYNSPSEDLFQMEKANWKTPPKLLFELCIEYADGKNEVVTSDESWKWNTGEIVYNSIRGGETIDHRRQEQNWNNQPFNDGGWKNVAVVPEPAGKLAWQVIPPMRINERVAPEKISEPRKGVYLVDFGKNMTGWISLRIKGRPGQKVTCWYNEALDSGGVLNKRYSATHTATRFQKEEFILKGGEREYFEPRFTYHGFRYVQLEGLGERPAASDIIASAVFTSLDTTGYFSCSDQKINQLQMAVQRTLLNSIHGIPGEEPTREKMGWTQDASTAMEPYLYNFDAINAYKKCLQDFMDGQEPGGHIPSIVPTNGWSFLSPDGKPIYYDDPWWGGTIFHIADLLYDHTGDTGTLAYAFDAMKRYLDFVATTAKNDIVYWSLGDWLDMTHGKNGPGLTPVEQTSTAAYYWMNERLAVFAQLLGRNAVSQEYAAHSKRIKEAFNTAFLDTATGWYKKGSQTAQALPLYLGMVPVESKHKVEDRLMEAIEENNNHVSTGFVGVVPFLSYLAENGFMKKCYEVFSQRDSPGWLQMVANEKSTLGENLNSKGYGSGNHPFGAHIGFWLFKYLGGIRVDPARPGFQDFVLEPQFIKELNWVRAETHSLYGKIVLEWKREGGKIAVSVMVPGNTHAKLELPSGGEVLAGGRNFSAVAGVKLIGNEGYRVVYQLGSGEYEFSIEEK